MSYPNPSTVSALPSATGAASARTTLALGADPWMDALKEGL